MSSVSILIDTYNNGPWLRACVDSALAQTHPADEVIVYDDGSSDDSLAILRSYGERITLIAGVHDSSRSGRSSQRAAIRAAFAKSTADHIYFLDGDDTYLPTHVFDYEVTWAAHPEAVMLQCPMILIDSEGRALGPYREARKNRRDYLADIYRHSETDYFYICSSFAFKRQFLVHAFPIIANCGFDYYVDVHLALHAVFCGSIITMPAASAVFRIHADSMSERDGLRGGRRVHDTRQRTRCFNTVAAHYGRPPLRLWRNFTYLQQLARLWLPNWFTLPFARLKVRLVRNST
jgi:glycosyltransferase involved in cell wall biosynthesis